MNSSLSISFRERLTHSLEARFKPQRLVLINESENHNVPPGSETHWNVTLVSEAFEGQSLVARHRMVYDCLARELEEGIHALALTTLAPSEWEKSPNTGVRPSPPCRGGDGGR